MRGGAEVELRIKGKNVTCLATVIENDPPRIQEALRHYLALFPQDAAYHDIKLNPDRSPVVADLEKAANTSIVVEANLVSDIWK